MNAQSAIGTLVKRVRAPTIMPQRGRRGLEVVFHLQFRSSSFNLSLNLGKRIVESIVHDIAQHSTTRKIGSIFSVNKSLHSFFNVLVCEVLETGVSSHMQPLALYCEEDGLSTVVRRRET